MGKEEYIVDGYQFSSRAEYDRAKKEKETIAYLTANTDSSDMKALLKVYNRSVAKKSFQTVIGQHYLNNLRRRIIGSGMVSEELLGPIPISVRAVPETSGRRPGVSGEENASLEQAARYKKLYENAVADRKIKNILISVLVCVIVGMIVITATAKYSVVTFFTDYETKIRNEVTDEMEAWENKLEQKEAELEKREEQLQQQTP